MFPRLRILFHFPSTTHERIRNGVYDLTVREHSKVRCLFMWEYYHVAIRRVTRLCKHLKLCEATGANVVAVAGYKTLLMELLCRFFGHQSSVVRSVKDSEHVRKFIAYVGLLTMMLLKLLKFSLSFQSKELVRFVEHSSVHFRRSIKNGSISFIQMQMNRLTGGRCDQVICHVQFASSRAQVKQVLFCSTSFISLMSFTCTQ